MKSKGVKLAMVITPRKDTNVYSTVKKAAELTTAVSLFIS